MMRLRTRWLILACFVLALLIAGVWVINQLHFSYSGQTCDTKGVCQARQFIITQGQSTEEIVRGLKDQGSVNSYGFAVAYAHYKTAVFLPGTYNLPSSYTLPELITLLGKVQLNDKKLVIPEGYTRQQIADSLDQFSLSATTFLQLTKADEGMLFPDTYDVNVKTTEVDLRQRMVDQYAKKTSGLDVSRSDLILASIVEREAKTDAERPIIAGIYKNRLSIGMGLEADPTVQYAKYIDLGQAPIKDGKKNYWAAITKADYAGVISPYNTYLHVGLPPGPICNPGLKSINAVLNATKTDAFYFFETPSGQLITSKTLAEHNANKAKYLK